MAGDSIVGVSGPVSRAEEEEGGFVLGADESQAVSTTRGTSTSKQALKTPQPQQPQGVLAKDVLRASA